MRPTLVLLAFLAGNALSTAGQAVIIDTILQKRRRSKLPILTGCYAVIYLVSSLAHIFSPHNPASSIFLSVCLLFLASLLYRTGWPMRLLSTVFTLMLTVPSESVAAFFLCLVFHVPFSQLNAVPYRASLGLLLSGAIVLLLSFLSTKLFLKKEEEGIRLPAQYWATVILIPIFSIIVCLVLVYDSAHRTPVAETTALVGICLLLGINLLVFYLYKKLLQDSGRQYQSLLLKQQSEAYARQLALEQQTNECVRTLRHDLKNHAIAVQALIQWRDKRQAAEYVGHILEELSEAEQPTPPACSPERPPHWAPDGKGAAPNATRTGL